MLNFESKLNFLKRQFHGYFWSISNRSPFLEAVTKFQALLTPGQEHRDKVYTYMDIYIHPIDYVSLENPN